jgi:hypothetical protein
MNDLQLKPLYGHEIVIGEQKEKKHLGKYVPRIDGGKIFEYNPETGYLVEVLRNEVSSKKIFTNKGCYYVEALNTKNAIKKLKKGVLICRS